jgi:hypothetical protein
MAKESGTEQRAGGASTTSAAAGTATKAEGNGGGNAVSALGGVSAAVAAGLERESHAPVVVGGLAALAAIEIIEWPVALVVGAGSLVAERMVHQDAEDIAAWRS